MEADLKSQRQCRPAPIRPPWPAPSPLGPPTAAPARTKRRSFVTLCARCGTLQAAATCYRQYKTCGIVQHVA
eukprot:1303010-Rhodomonas_salina.1